MGEDRKIISVHPDILHCDSQKGAVVKHVTGEHLAASAPPNCWRDAGESQTAFSWHRLR